MLSIALNSFLFNLNFVSSEFTSNKALLCFVGTFTLATSVIGLDLVKEPWFSLGSSASRIPSPSKLMPITIIKIIIPGIRDVWGWIIRDDLPSPSIDPKSDCGGCEPNPRKDSPAVSRIIQPTVVEKETTITGVTFGKISKNKISVCERPDSLDALIKSEFVNVIVTPLTFLAKKGMLTIATAINAFIKLGPSTATIARANKT